MTVCVCMCAFFCHIHNWLYFSPFLCIYAFVIWSVCLYAFGSYFTAILKYINIKYKIVCVCFVRFGLFVRWCSCRCKSIFCVRFFGAFHFFLLIFCVPPIILGPISNIVYEYFFLSCLECCCRQYHTTPIVAIYRFNRWRGKSNCSYAHTHTQPKCLDLIWEVYGNDHYITYSEAESDNDMKS